MNEKYWKQFENSGKIEDYLSFVSDVKQSGPDESEQVKQGEHAGIYICDRNHTETSPDGGVRQTYLPFD